jgi:hypothetical protein
MIELSNEYVEQLKSIDLEWDFAYWSPLYGDDEPGAYELPREASLAYAKAEGWENTDGLVEIRQDDVAKIQAAAIANQSCSVSDKIILDHLLSEM